LFRSGLLHAPQLAADWQEFSNLKGHNTVYKLIGPALVPQEHTEATANVEKRIEFIKGEM
jgi:prefoldin beta subunit